jgi:carbonic anhydrase
MTLLGSILEANEQAPAGHAEVPLPAGTAEATPVVVGLTCVDPRLNALLPGRLGLMTEKFIWLRSAGNIVTEPDGNMVRSLALACAVKRAREILIIGHTDCAVSTTPVRKLKESFEALGVPRQQLPGNLVDFFGLFTSAGQNVLRGVEIVRGSPLIGPAVPVHGLVLDVQTGRLECLVNGYATGA